MDMWRLRRSVARLRAAFRRDGTNVFYMVSERSWPDDELSRLTEALARSRARNSLAVVTLTANDGPHDHTMLEVAGVGCRRLDVHIATRSRSRGAAFSDPEDDRHLGDVIMRIAARLDPTSNGHI
jgi:hypothetical protein